MAYQEKNYYNTKDYTRYSGKEEEYRKPKQPTKVAGDVDVDDDDDPGFWKRHGKKVLAGALLLAAGALGVGTAEYIGSRKNRGGSSDNDCSGYLEDNSEE